MFAEINSDILALVMRGEKHSIWKYRSIGYVAPMFLEIKKIIKCQSNLYFRPTVERGMVKAIVHMLFFKKKLTQQSKVIKKALNYKVKKKINYLVVGGGGGGEQLYEHTNVLVN